MGVVATWRSCSAASSCTRWCTAGSCHGRRWTSWWCWAAGWSAGGLPRCWPAGWTGPLRAFTRGEPCRAAPHRGRVRRPGSRRGGARGTGHGGLSGRQGTAGRTGDVGGPVGQPRENLTFSHAVMRRVRPDHRCVVVTNNFHVLRAAVLARRCGVRGQVVGPRTPWYFWPNATIREFIALVVENWRVNCWFGRWWWRCWWYACWRDPPLTVVRGGRHDGSRSAPSHVAAAPILDREREDGMRVSSNP